MNMNGVNAGRSNYFGSMGAMADMNNISDPMGGIFNVSGTTPVGQTPKGLAITSVSDGTSNTGMFAEVIRGTYGSPGTISLDYTSFVQSPTLSGSSLYDGRTVSGCAGGASGVLVSYIGQEYYRALPITSTYTHTLPPNWNQNTGSTSSQKYRCGDTSFTRAHIAASSYHTGGVNIVMADGSVRFVANSIDFPTWQAAGSRAGGETLNLP
jgi:prepilin-type processing-associated H-X9-DG protein